MALALLSRASKTGNHHFLSLSECAHCGTQCQDIWWRIGGLSEELRKCWDDHHSYCRLIYGCHRFLSNFSVSIHIYIHSDLYVYMHLYIIIYIYTGSPLNWELVSINGCFWGTKSRPQTSVATELLILTNRSHYQSQYLSTTQHMEVSQNEVPQ